MARAVRPSILNKSLVVGCCLVLFTYAAMAQHPIGRTAGPAPAAPIYHAPTYRAPVYQGPSVSRTPNYVSIYARRTSAGSPGHALGIVTVRPPFRPIHPFRPVAFFYIFPVVNGPFWPATFCWWATCDQFLGSEFFYNSAPNDLWNPANSSLPPASEAPVYVYGEERWDSPQLFLKDGTDLYVTDYWLVDDQLHFMITQEDGMKPEEQVIPFDELDLQKTVDVNSKRGFRFMLRNEPFEQYVRDHPEGPPAALSPQQ
jgi:hypothetical protein